MTMALLKPKDLRAMRPDGRETKLKELNDELMHERGVAAMGGAPASPGKIRAVRKNIARIMTVQRELELAGERPAEVPNAKNGKKLKAPISRPEKEAAGEVEDDDKESLDREDQEEKK